MGGATTLDGLLLLHLHNLLPVGIGPLLVSSSLAELPHISTPWKSRSDRLDGCGYVLGLPPHPPKDSPIHSVIFHDMLY